MGRRKKKDPKVAISGMGVRSKIDLVAESPGVRNHLLDVGAEPTVEIRFEIPGDWDGEFPLDPEALRGVRVKPVVVVPEELAGEVDRHGLRQRILDSGATYCKVPHVHVARGKVRRDERHAPELDLEESLRIFAEETGVEHPDELVRRAAALAREADAEKRERA